MLPAILFQFHFYHYLMATFMCVYEMHTTLISILKVGYITMNSKSNHLYSYIRVNIIGKTKAKFSNRVSGFTNQLTFS